MPDSATRFLGADATREDLLRAVASNHRRSMSREARRAGGAICRENGAVWIWAPGTEGGAGQVTIPFPRMAGDAAGAQIDAILHYCRSRPAPIRSVSCWAQGADESRDLGVRLAARGFEWGWQPHWMRLDLEGMREDFPIPEGLRIERAEPGAAWDVEDLPYYNREEAGRGGSDKRSWHFGAWLDGRIVGHSSLFLTTGRLGVAGIYGCGVVPDMRRRGVGKAVTAAACQQARDLGCRHALLNATFDGERAYRGLGFVSVGYGQTWWLHRERLEAPPPTRDQIRFAEAVGLGNRAALDKIGGAMSPETLDAPLPCGMTPLGLAVQTRQSDAAEWLAARGATLDVISVWELGWKGRIPALLAERPELTDRRYEPDNTTALHRAAWDNNLELIRLLLDAGADPSLTDSVHGATPARWARFNNNVAAAEMIEERLGKRVRP